MGEYDFAIAFASILSAIATIAIAAWAINTARSAKTQADAAKEQSRISQTQAEAAKIQAEASLLQTKLSVREINETLRPWITVVGFKPDSRKLWHLSYTNVGKTPPQSMKITTIVDNTEISREELDNEPFEEDNKIGIIFPGVKKIFTFNDLDEDITQEVKDNKIELWIGIKFEYIYGSNKLGKFCTICKYISETARFSVKSEWTDEPEISTE